jgi:hypothetical protein
MGMSKWLSKLDRHNQEVLDALRGQADIEGPGVLIVSRWSQGDAGGFRERWSHLRIDDLARSRLKWGSTFHQLAPGEHRLQFGRRVLRNSWVEVDVSVPMNGHITVEYQPAVWPWQRADVKVIR